MNDRRVDLIARCPARGFSRRQALKLAVGGALATSALATRRHAVASEHEILDLGLAASAVLPVLDDGLVHSGGGVYLSEQAFARIGETTASAAPLIFGDAEASQVRLDVFSAADGSHNVYLYQMATPHTQGAAAIVAGLHDQFHRPDAEDVSKDIGGWDENRACRFAFPTGQGNLSRIQSFNAVDDYAVWLVDDRYGDRKNTVTLHRNILEELPKVRKWFDPNPGDGPDEPPGLLLSGSMPIVESVEQFSWVQAKRDGVVVPRFNVDSAITEQNLEGVVNAFNGSYAFQRDGALYSVFTGFREFADPGAAMQYANAYPAMYAQSDQNINLTRVRDETAEFPDDIETQIEAFAYGLGWEAAPGVVLLGANIVVLDDTVVFDLAMFTEYDDDLEPLESGDFIDFEFYERLYNAALTLLVVSPSVWERFEVGPNPRFPIRPVPIE